MSKLLSSDCFDSFLLIEANIRMQVTFHMDGHLNQDFFDSDVWNDRVQRPYDLAPWSDVRHFCRDCIKGSHAPAAASFVLMLKPEYVAASLSDVSENTRNAVASLVITIRLGGALPAGMSEDDAARDSRKLAETGAAASGRKPAEVKTALAGGRTPAEVKTAVAGGRTPAEVKAAVAGGRTPAEAKAAMPRSGQLRLLTGVSYQNFVLDKSAEQAWDRIMERFLQAKGIEYEQET